MCASPFLTAVTNEFDTDLGRDGVAGGMHGDRSDRAATQADATGGDAARGDATAAALSRRRLLTSGVAAGTLATAGCLGTRDGEVPEPVVTHDSIDRDWRLVDTTDGIVFEESYGLVTVRALERTAVYEYVDIAAAVADTLDADGSPVVFFATRIDLRPAIDRLPAGVGRGRLMTEVQTAAKTAFRAQLRESGVTDIEEVDTGETTTEGGHTATTTSFRAGFGLEWEVPLADGSTTTAADVAEMAARLAVWHDGTDVLLSGGAHPTEPLSAVVERGLDAPADADAVVDELVDGSEALATEPEAFAEAVEALIPAVQ